MKRVLFGILAASSALAAEGAAGPQLSLTGKLFTDIYAPYALQNSPQLRQSSVSLWPQIDAKLSETSSAHAELTLNQFDKSQRASSGFETGLREGFATVSKNGFDLRVGKQVIPWGKTDGLNAVDFLTAKDFTILLPEDDLRKTGTTTILATVTPKKGASPFSITAAWVPVPPQSRLLIASGVVPSSFTVNSTQAPAATIANSEEAIKATYAGGKWDADIIAYRGYNHMPEFTLSALGGTPLAPTFTLTPVLHKQQALGADMSMSFSEFILRAEGAHVWTENNDGSQPLNIPRHVEGIVGVEKPFMTDFRVIAQFMARKFYNLSGPDKAPGSSAFEIAGNKAAMTANQLLLNYQDDFRPTGTLRVGYNAPSLDWDAEVSCVYNFHGQDWLLRPKASYLWTDAFRTTIGMDRYDGPDSRFFGSMKNFNSVFAEAKYSF